MSMPLKVPVLKKDLFSEIQPDDLFKVMINLFQQFQTILGSWGNFIITFNYISLLFK